MASAGAHSSTPKTGIVQSHPPTAIDNHKKTNKIHSDNVNSCQPILSKYIIEEELTKVTKKKRIINVDLVLLLMCFLEYVPVVS